MGVVKKIFIISTILLLIVMVFFGIYMIAFKKDTPLTPTQTPKKDMVDVADMVSKKITNLTSDSIISATIGPDGNTIRYYDGVDGRAWTMTLRGTNKEVLRGDTGGVPQKVKWSDDGTSAIVTYDNGVIEVYNHATQQKNTLRDGMDDVEWAGRSGKILYKYYDKETQERTLNIAQSDGTGWKKIVDLPYRFTRFVQVPSSILAAYWQKADAQQKTPLTTVSTISTANSRDIFPGAFGADYLFSPNGKKILVSSVSDNKGVTLGVMDANGENYTDFHIPTIVQKAVWSKDSQFVYYALPNNVPEGTVWPNDYDANQFTTQDTFFKIEVSSGKNTRLIELGEITESLDAYDLFLSPQEDLLFFTNKTNHLLYRLHI